MQALAPTRLSQYCDQVIEAGWLAALLTAPLFFNTHSSRIFEPEKIAMVRSLALVMVLAWLVRGLETWFSGSHDRGADRERWRAAYPILIPALLLLLIQAVATVFSITPRISLWGSYIRLQGLYTTASYLILFLSLLALLRTREQVERLVTTVLIGSLPVALYGIIQHYGTDPLPWGADVVARVASTLGNPIFVAAYLIMVVPLSLYRLITAGRRVTATEQADIRTILLSGFLLSMVFQLAAWSIGPIPGTVSGLITVAVWLSIALLLDRPPRAFLQVGGYTVLLAAQFMCIVFSKSRGPWLGLGAGLFFFALLWTTARHRLRPARLIAGTGVALLLILTLLNLFPARQGMFRELPYVNRLGQLFQAGEGSGRVRVLIWEGAVALAGADPVRTLIGYGPETMLVAFPPYAPPGLGSISEAALPDRAHNETFDRLLTTGLAGVAFYLLLFTGLVFFGLQRLGLLPTPGRRRLFLGCWAAGGLAAAALAVWIDGSWRFTGVLLPLGMVGGLFIYAGAILLRRQPEPRTPPPGTPILLLTAAVLSALLAHFVEIQFGITIAATGVYFWSYAAVLVVAGLGMGRGGETAAAPEKSIPASPRTLTAGSLMVVLMTATLLYAFWLPGLHLSEHPDLLWLPVFSWSLAGLLLLTEAPAVSLPRALGRYVLLTVSLSAAYALLHDRLLSADTVYALFAYFGFVLLTVLLLGGALLLGTGQPSRFLVRKAAPAYPILAGVLLFAAYAGNVRPIQADLYHKRGREAANGDRIEAAADQYRRALILAPKRDDYYLWLGQALALQAQRTADPDVQTEIFEQAAEALQRALRLNPLHPDHAANMGRLHLSWALATPDASLRRQHLTEGRAYLEAAARRHPNNALLWSTRGTAALLAGDPAAAVQALERSLLLDDANARTYQLLGDAYRARKGWPEAAQAYEQSLALTPDNVALRRTLQAVYARMRQDSTALSRSP